MPTDITEVLVDMVKEVQSNIKEVKDDVKEVKEKQQEASVSISVIKTMQEAIANLKIDERLRQVELTQSQSTGGVSLFKWIIPTALSIAGIVIALVR